MVKRAGAGRVAATLRDARARLGSGDLGGAEALCRSILDRAPRNPGALHLMGLARLGRGEPREAASWIGRALEADPANAEMLEHHGLACLALGENSVAERVFRRALAAGAGHGLLHMRLGLALGGQAKHDEAIAALRTAARLAPDDADVQLNLGNGLAVLGRTGEALEAYRRALASKPGRADVLTNMGTVLKDMGRLEEARQAYQRALDADPRSTDARNGLGITYEAEERFEEAMTHYRTALNIDPGNVAAHCNLASAARMLGRLPQAEKHALEALSLDRTSVDALFNLANVREQQARFEETRACYEAALRLAPSDPDLQLAYAGLCLGLNDFDAGWRAYRFRPSRRRALAAGAALDEALPPDLAGRRVLLLGEQGLGDELFFLRFAAPLAALGAKVICECDRRIAGMVERSGIFEAVVAAGDALPPRDLAFLAADVPALMPDVRHPAQLPLSALEARVTAMRERLSGLGPPPYIGVTWRAGTPPETQRLRRTRVLYKEAPLARLGEALRVAPGTLLAFQRGPRGGEIAALADAAGRQVHDCSAANDDLEDMLALLALTDAYVGVSNTNMHLAAGLGTRAYVLVSYPGEWRWMAEGDRSAWFPGFALYRQAANRDWEAALSRLSTDLRRLVTVRMPR